MATKKLTGFLNAQLSAVWVLCCGTTCVWVLLANGGLAYMVNTCNWMIMSMCHFVKGIAVLVFLCVSGHLFAYAVAECLIELGEDIY